MSYREHPAKVVRLIDGKLVPYPPAADEDCTLWVALPEPGEWEGVLGRRRSKETVEVVGIPVFAYDLNLGDVVSVVSSAALARSVDAMQRRGIRRGARVRPRCPGPGFARVSG